MTAIEPNTEALLWFALFWTLCCLGFLALSGSFPLGVNSERGRASNTLLALLNGGLMLLFAGFTLSFGYTELRTTTVVIIVGLAILFAPASFEVWPERWRDGRAVLSTLLFLQLGALAGLYAVAGALVIPSV